jgi:hypothetical protein
LSVDVTANDGLPTRIANIVCSYPHPVHTIFIFNELMHVPTAKAVEILSLLTVPANAYAICTDKYATRTLAAEEDKSLQVLQFSDKDELCSKI